MPTAAVIGGGAILGAISSRNASKSAVKAQDKAATSAADQTTQAADRARADINRLFPQAQQAGQQGFQGAIDVFNQGINPQMQAFQGGNVAAQNQILAGLPQIQNALLGNQVDLSGLQAYQAPQQDLSFMDQQLPYMQQQDANAQMNNGLGSFDPNNASFNGVMGPFQSGSASQRPPVINTPWLAGNTSPQRFR